MYQEFHGEQVGAYPRVDQVLREYFPDYSYHGTIIEVGAFHPIEISNSYHFEKNGWSAYCMEANPIGIDKFTTHRKRPAINYAVANYNQDDVDFDLHTGYSAAYSALHISERLCRQTATQTVLLKKIKVNVRTLDWLLQNTMPEVQKIDILTVDVEGGEMDVLKGFDIDRWSPTVIFLEDHFYDGGKSDTHQFLVAHGYRLDKKLDHNCFYVRKNEF